MKNMVFSIVALIIGMYFASIVYAEATNDQIQNYYDVSRVDITLPPPVFTNNNLETSISRRMSVRDFDGSTISDQELSNILWAAYGYTDSDTRTIHSISGRYAIVIYVIRRDNTYTYLPEEHALALFREGDFTSVGLYDSAPVKLGLVWDTDVSSDEYLAWVELGMIGQNIYFMANALDLGMVTTSSSAEELNLLQLPSSQRACIVMPLGHPAQQYGFTYDPFPESTLPSVVQTSMSLEDAINSRQVANEWVDEPLTTVEQSQLLWASYGYSQYIDTVNGRRHRTVPSSMGTYPLQVYAANHTGVYRYDAGTHGVVTIAEGDRRSGISAAVASSSVLLSSASWILLCFLDTRVGAPEGWRLNAWFYEAGAVAHTLLLECTAFDVSANMVYSGITDDMLRSAVGLSTDTYLDPLLLMPCGKTETQYENTPPTVTISSPTSGQTVTETIAITGTASDPDSDDQLQRIQIRIDAGQWIDATGTTNWTYNWNTKSVSNGEHTIDGRADDGIDYSPSASVTITVSNEKSGTNGDNGKPPDRNTPPIADAGGPYFEYVSIPVTFNGSNSYDPDTTGYIDSWSWDVGDGTTFNGISLTHIYNKTGNYTVTLKVTDNGGKTDTDTTYALIKEKPNIPPEPPEITGPTDGFINTNYSFSIITEDVDGDNISCSVYWGDGTSTISDILPNGTVYTTYHIWVTPGKYIINVTVLDEHNSISENTSLIIIINMIHYVANFGFLIDNDSDGVFEIFYINATGNETNVEQIEEGQYKIDTDGNGEWNIIYGPLSGTITSRDKNDETAISEFFLDIIPKIVVLVAALVVFVYLYKKGNFQNNV